MTSMLGEVRKRINCAFEGTPYKLLDEAYNDKRKTFRRFKIGIIKVRKRELMDDESFAKDLADRLRGEGNLFFGLTDEDATEVERILHDNGMDFVRHAMNRTYWNAHADNVGWTYFVWHVNEK